MSQKVSIVKGNGVSLCTGVGPFGYSGSIGTVDSTNGDYGIKAYGGGDISTNDNWQATITSYKSYDFVRSSEKFTDKCTATGFSIVAPLPVAPWVGITKGADLNFGETVNGEMVLTGITISEGFTFSPMVQAGVGGHVSWGESKQTIYNNDRYDRLYDSYNKLYEEALEW